jgi:hypothetical protein
LPYIPARSSSISSLANGIRGNLNNISHPLFGFFLSFGFIFQINPNNQKLCPTKIIYGIAGEKDANSGL